VKNRKLRTSAVEFSEGKLERGYPNGALVGALRAGRRARCVVDGWFKGGGFCRDLHFAAPAVHFPLMPVMQTGRELINAA